MHVLDAAEFEMGKWARWLLEERFGGDRDAMKAMLTKLGPVRDRVLDSARLRPGDTLLDVGTGDGLVGFAALERLGPEGRVVFSDVSAELLDTCRVIAEAEDVLDRCRFVRTAAESLDGVGSQSVDVVTIRSVLIYVDAKQAVLHAFRRVLRPGGRLSLFEPLNRTMKRLNRDSLWGYDARGVGRVIDELTAVFEDAVERDTGAMLGFDAADLVTAADRAGFDDIGAQVVVARQHES